MIWLKLKKLRLKYPKIGGGFASKREDLRIEKASLK